MTKGFKRMFVLLLVFLLIVATLSGGKSIYNFLFTAAIMWFGMRFILSHNARNLYILYYAGDKVIESGDMVNIQYKISNTSFIPIMHAIIDFKLDPKIDSESKLKEIAYFGSNENRNYSKQMLCKYRGYYKVGQVLVEINDPLLLSKRVINFNKEMNLTVHPRVVPINSDMFESRDLFGTLKSNVRTLEDRTNLVNIRPYNYGDQLKNIHWKVSAKKDELQTKEFEQTVSSKLVILINGYRIQGVDLDLEEKMVSFCASLIKRVLDQQIHIKLIMNDASGTTIESNTSQDFHEFLEGLTGFKCDSELAFATFINHRITESHTEQSQAIHELVAITPRLSKAFVHGLNTRGQRIHVFSFAPTSSEERELMAKGHFEYLRFHTIDAYMEVSNES